MTVRQCILCCGVKHSSTWKQFAVVARWVSCGANDVGSGQLHLLKRGLPRYKLYTKEIVETGNGRPLRFVLTGSNPNLNSEVNTRRILNVEACFGSTGQQLAAYGRVLVGEGVLVKMCRKKPKPRQFFLFNDILVYGNILISKKRYNKQHVIPLEDVQLQNLEDEGDMKNGWLIKTRLKSFAVFAATSTEKKEWILHIERCVHDILTRGGKKPATEHAAVWVPDGEATKCMACRRTQFTVIQRRHHCRACGNVVCSTCSSHNYRIPVSKRPVRVCDTDSGRSNAVSSEPGILNDGSSDSDDEDKNVTYDLQPTFYSRIGSGEEKKMDILL